MRKDKKVRMRNRSYVGTIERNGEKIGLEAETLLTVIKEFGGNIEGENLNNLGTILFISQKARLLLGREMPRPSANLDEWFKWQDSMERAGQVVTLQDIAENSSRAYETVKKAHAIYKAEPNIKE